MDQIVNLPKTESDSAIETALGLDHAGRRGWLYALLTLIVLVAAFAGYQWYAGTPTRIDYTTVPAAKADLTVQVSATGTLQPLTQVDISSELSGIIRSVSAEENQQVKKGDVLATLDT
ncbi:MAG: biotin/lipoyl-binding protein, partial [Mesorhizobium sp.]